MLVFVLYYGGEEKRDSDCVSVLTIIMAEKKRERRKKEKEIQLVECGSVIDATSRKG